MKRLSACIILAILAALPVAAASSSVSMPSFWRYAHPEAKALIGIEWNRILNSSIGAEIRQKLYETGAEGEEALALMDQVERIFVTSPGNPPGGQEESQPPVVVAAQGNFDLAQVREMLRQESAEPVEYESIEILEHVDEKGHATAVALVNSRLLVAGDMESVAAAIDHYHAADPSQMSDPLFQRASQLSANNDIWLVAHASPSDFGQSGMEQAQFLQNVRRVEAGISLQSGLGLELNLGADSAQSASELAAGLQMILGMMLAGQQQQNPNGPNLAEKLSIAADQDLVRLALQLDQSELEQGFGQLATSLPGSFGGGAPAEEGGSLEAASASAPAAPAGGFAGWNTTQVRPVEPEGPRVITIWGLEEGPLEIDMNQ